MDNLTTYTELFGKNCVGEIEACTEKDVWRRVNERVLLQHLTDSLVLPSNVEGKVLQHKQGDISFVSLIIFWAKKIQNAE